MHILVKSPEYWNAIKKNKPPVAYGTHYSSPQGAELEARLNATDDYDSWEQLTFLILQPPVSGSRAVLDGGKFVYTPKGDYWGPDWFVFQVDACIESFS